MEATVKYDLPYDYEVAYLKTIGLSMIDLGVAVTDQTRIVMDIRNVKTDVLRYHFGGCNRHNDSLDDITDVGGAGADINGWPVYDADKVLNCQLYWRGNDETSGVIWKDGVPDSKNVTSELQQIQGFSCSFGYDKYDNGTLGYGDNHPATHVIAPIHWDEDFTDPDFDDKPFIDVTLDYNVTDEVIYRKTEDTFFRTWKIYYEQTMSGTYKKTTSTEMVEGVIYFEAFVNRHLKVTPFGSEGPQAGFLPTTFNDTFPLDTHVRNQSFDSQVGLKPGDTGSFAVLKSNYSQCRGFTGRLYGIRFYASSTSRFPFADFYPVVKGGRVGLYERIRKRFVFPTVGVKVSANRGDKRFEDTEDFVLQLPEPGPETHTHDDLFPRIYGTQLGFIGGDTLVLTGDDKYNSYKLVDELPPISPDGDKVIILSRNIEPYAEGQVLVTDGYSAWQPIEPSTEGPGDVTDIKSFKLTQPDGSAWVHIRWKDPVYNGKIGWKCTRLLRKAGSYPAGPYDGILVAQNTVRDFHYDVAPVHDTLPSQISTVWYYKLFAISEDNTVSASVTTGFVPVEFDWEKLSAYIQGGLAPSIWGIGDKITVGDGSPIFTGINKFYNKMEFKVAGFDIDTPKSGAKYHHTVTLVATFMPTLNGERCYDQPWGPYRLVVDEYVDGSKTYYVKNGTSFKRAVPQPSIGTKITELDGYYEPVRDERASYGTNQWKESALRKWMNAVRQNYYSLTTDTTVNTSKTYYRLDSDGSYVPVTDVDPSDHPRMKGWFEKGAAISYFTKALPPLLAIKEVDKSPNHAFYNTIITVQTKSANNSSLVQKQGASTVTDDRIRIPSVMEVFGEKNNGVTEGKTRLPLFEIAFERQKRYGEGETSSSDPSPWFLRSADTGSESNVLSVKEDGSKATEASAATRNYGIVFVLTLG